MFCFFTDIYGCIGIIVLREILCWSRLKTLKDRGFYIAAKSTTDVWSSQDSEEKWSETKVEPPVRYHPKWSGRLRE